MAHYAYVNKDNIVFNVIVGRDEDDLEPGINSWEEYFQSREPEGVKVLRTSYNTLGGKHVNGGEPFRKNYAGIGFFYDEDNDAFIPPQPFPSWTLNEESFLWDSPVPYPNDGALYYWDDELGEWVEEPS